MSVTITAPGYVDDAGHFSIDKRTEFHEAIKALAGHEVVVKVTPKQRKRSLNQNAYWWAEPVKRLAEHCGYTPAQMHYALLGECFGYVAGPTGQPVPMQPSSSALNVREFSVLIDWVLVWANAELGVAVMPPDEWQKTEAA